LLIVFGYKLNFDKMVLYTVAGEDFYGDLVGFEQLGITINRTGNITFMKAPVMGSSEFLSQFCKDKAEEVRKVYRAIDSIPNKHVAFYLMKYVGGVCRLMYLMRVTPRDFITELLHDADAEMKQCFEGLVGNLFDDDSLNSWQQATLPVRMGGAGLRNCMEVADAAYIYLLATHVKTCVLNLTPCSTRSCRMIP
jgi:hypothetical protein